MQQPSYLDEVDKNALSLLYQRYAQGIFTYLRLHVPSREDAEDLLVETFLAACEHASFHRYSEQQQRLWLWRVARNKVVDHYRAFSRRQALDVDELSDEIYVDEDLSPAYLAERGEEYVLLRDEVKKLSPLQQHILHLHFGHGLRCTDIARQLGKSDSAVRMYLSRTLKFLRSIYVKHEGRNDG